MYKFLKKFSYGDYVLIHNKIYQVDRASQHHLSLTNILNELSHIELEEEFLKSKPEKVTKEQVALAKALYADIDL